MIVIVRRNVCCPPGQESRTNKFKRAKKKDQKLKMMIQRATTSKHIHKQAMYFKERGPPLKVRYRIALGAVIIIGIVVVIVISKKNWANQTFLLFQTTDSDLFVFPDYEHETITAEELKNERKQAQISKYVLNVDTIEDDLEKRCDWVETSIVPSSGRVTNPTRKKLTLCVNPENDLISNVIRRAGRWTDCESMVTMYDQLQEKNSNEMLHVQYLDIGANIGTCVFEILSLTNMNVIAFEPSQLNLFYFKQSLKRFQHDFILQQDWGKDFKERIQIFPFALGFENNTNVLLSINPKNTGGAYVVNQNNNQNHQPDKSHPSETVQMVLLDELFQLPPPNFLRVPSSVKWIIKVDTEGSECRFLCGATGFFRETPNQVVFIKMEYNYKNLKRTGCSPFVLFSLIDSFGYTAYFEKSLTGKNRYGHGAAPITIAQAQDERSFQSQGELILVPNFSINIFAEKVCRRWREDGKL